MKTYSILIKKNSEQKITDLVVLKDGFSYSALFFGGFWFLYHKMWREFLALLLVTFVLGSPHGFLPKFDQIFLLIALSFVVAFNANYWFVENLKKCGYEFVDLVPGLDEDEARFNFVKNQEIRFDDSFLNPKLYHKLNPRKIFS
jgi:hypothetical protein